jgi:nucleoid-associated protein YgaU
MLVGMLIVINFIIESHAAFNAKKINIISEAQMKDIIDKAKGIEHINYTIKEGDTLASISEHFFGFTCWKVVYDENKDIIGEDPNLIIPGQILKITIKR